MPNRLQNVGRVLLAGGIMVGIPLVVAFGVPALILAVFESVHAPLSDVGREVAALCGLMLGGWSVALIPVTIKVRDD